MLYKCAVFFVLYMCVVPCVIITVSCLCCMCVVKRQKSNDVLYCCVLFSCYIFVLHVFFVL